MRPRRTIGDISDITSDPIAASQVLAAFAELGALTQDPSALCTVSPVVLAFQQAVNAATGEATLTEDGEYGPMTARYAQLISPDMPGACAAFGTAQTVSPSSGVVAPVTVTASKPWWKYAAWGLGGVAVLGAGWLFFGDR
jgi:hypothetical protein